MLSSLSPIRVLLLCLLLGLTQGGLVPVDLSPGVTTITTTSIPTGDTYVYNCLAGGPCTIDIVSGVMFELATGAALELNDVTLKHATASDAIRMSGVSSVVMNNVVISPLNTALSVVHALSGSSATITFSQVTSSARIGGGNTIFCESAALCDISVDSHTATGNTDVFVKASLTTNLMASISNSDFISIAGTATLAALFDAEDSHVSLTLTDNLFDTVTTRFLRFKETSLPVNNFTLTMNNNNATKLNPAANSHAITFDKGLATIALNNNLIQLATVLTTGFGVFGLLTTSLGSSLVATGNQLITNASPMGHFYINLGFANVVLQDHYVTGCSGLNTQGVNFATASGGSLLVQNATFYNNVHSSGTIGMFAFVNSPLLTSITIRDSKFISNRVLGLGGDGVFSFKTVNLGSTTILFENNWFEDNLGLTQGSCIVFGTNSMGTATLRGNTFYANRAFSGAVRVSVSAQYSLIFDDCTFDSNLGTTDSGAIFSDGTTNNSTFYITNSRFINNQGGTGGVIAQRSSSGGAIHFVNSYFANNVATSNGGVLQIQNSASPVYFINSTFHGNSANFGGVLSIAMATQTYFVAEGDDVVFSNNEATTAGGVFYITGANRGFLFEHMHFENNSAPVGGAISVQNNMFDITVNDCSFTSNTASTMGGAIHVLGAIPTISNSEFSSNGAPKGSSIAIVSSAATQLSGLTFTTEDANYAPLWLESGTGVVTASDLDFSSNTGGAIYGSGTFSQSLSFTDIEFTENHDTDILSGVGDSIVTFDPFTGSVTFTNANFAENVVSTGSIVKFSGTGSLNFEDCDFTSNQGAILFANGQVDVTLTDCEFESNSALAEEDEDAKAMFSVFEVSSLSIHSSTLTGDEYDLFFDLKTVEPVSLSGVSIAAHSFEVSLFNIESTEVIFSDVNITIGDSDSLGTCFVLEKTASFTLTNTNVAKCQSTKAPALLFASGKSNIHITDSTFVDVTATVSSAFQVTESSQLTVIGSTFTNIADGLFFISGSFARGTFENTTVSQAVSTTSDASFFFINRGAHVSMTEVHVSDGESLSSGGCVIVDSGVLNWDGGSVSDCTTARQGAAFSFSGKVTAELRDLTIEHNSAFQGGAISMSQLFSSNVTIINSHFNNHEAENGGVLYLAVPTGNAITFTGCTFDSNSATTFGGVLMGLDAAHVDFVGCTMTDNTATYGGVGSLDWSATVTLLASTFQDNVASSSGGLFYLDKSSGVIIDTSSISGSAAEDGSGGAIYMSQSNVLTITHSNFTDNSATVDGGAISSPFGSKCTASISDSIFTSCHAGDKGGAISFSQFSASSLVLERNTFASNTAAYGGALSNQNAVNTPDVTTDIFEDNSASVYGDDVYSPPAALTTGSTSFQLLSGATLPTITVTLRDNYGNEYDQPPPQFFFAFMSIEAVSNVTKTPYLSGTTSQQITNGHVSFSEIKAFALPGHYRIKLGPSVGNTFYTGPTYIVYIDLEVKSCLNSEGNYQDTEDLGCMPILCSGCPIEKGATCVSPGNCSCPATLEGLQCEFLKDSYDSITLAFIILPALPTGHSNTEISVEMRDFILAELAKSYSGTEGLVVKFRSFVLSASRRRAEPTFDFKYSLLLDTTPVEGDLLIEYKDTAITFFKEEHGLGNSLESNVVTSDAAIVTYSDPVVIAVVILTAVFLALTVAFVVVTLLKKDTPVIRSSSPLFCLLILLGISFAYVTPFSYIGPQTTLSCAAPVVLGPLSFSIVFGNLLAKTFRIYRIFANKTMRAASPTVIQLLGFSGAVLGFEMLLVIIWLAVDPPVPVRMGPEGGRYWTCYSPLSSTMVPIIAAYDGVLLLFGVFLAFKTRNAFSAYKETQLIGFTIYTLSIVAVAILPVLYLIELPILAQFTIRSFSILFVATVTMFLLFGNKIIVILFLPQQNTTEYFNNQNGSSSVKGGFMLRPTNRAQTMSTTGFDLNDVKMSSQGWMMINENKPWSQWKNMYAVQTGEYFGFFENEDCSGHKGGLHPINQWVVERVQDDGHLQMKLTLGDHSCIAETPNPEDLEKWFNSLVKVAHVNL